MSVALRVLTLAVALGIVIVTVALRVASAQSPKQPHPKMQLLYIEDAAKVARADDPQSVRAFTDEIFSRSFCAQMAPSVKERIFRNELRYRHGEQPPVSQRDLVGALNEQVTAMAGAAASGQTAHLRTTDGQMQLFRSGLRRYVPHLLPTEGRPLSTNVSTDMSPAEVIFIATQLFQQKLHNPDYRVAPEEWERAARARVAHLQSKPGDLKPQSPRLGEPVVASPDEAALNLNEVGAALSDESSAAVDRIHAFLDRIGFQR